MKTMLKGKHIVLGISGGIAAYKSAALLRLLVKEGAEVQVVITPNGKEFITPVTLSALSGKPVVSEFFTANTGEWHSHVDLGLWADLMVIAPATASTIGKMANGIADNMLITTYLSAKEPVMIAPAMDLDMFAHPSTVRNLRQLREDGVIVLDSPSGKLASGLSGKGRMLEPDLILKAVVDFFNGADVAKPAGETVGKNHTYFQRKNVLITAGPTHENIDPVRFIGNHSSGKMGFCLAEEFAARGAEVTLICGPVGQMPSLSPGVRLVKVQTAMEMMKAVESLYAQTDVTVFAAAVADYRPVSFADRKIKREKDEELVLNLVANPDIAFEMGKKKRPGQINVGFALETDDGLANAKGKLARKNFDMIVLNPAGKKDAGFNSDTNRITLITENKAQELPLLSKRECAAAIADEISVNFSKI